MLNSDFRVGPWLVQPSLNTISQNGTSNRVEPKMMAVLVCLAGGRGEGGPKEKRSGERRGGEGGRSWGGPDDLKKKNSNQMLYLVSHLKALFAGVPTAPPSSID